MRFSFFGDGIGNRNMDGGSGGWKDICTYIPIPEEGLQFIRFRMLAFLLGLFFSFSFLYFFFAFFLFFISIWALIHLPQPKPRSRPAGQSYDLFACAK